jgi:hypothetical protein
VHPPVLTERVRLEELVEFVLSRPSKSAIRRSKEPTNAETAACASDDRVSQIACGSGGRSVMPPFYRPRGAEATVSLERLPLRNCLALRHPRGSIVSSGRPDEAAQRVGGLSSGKSRLHLEEGVSTVGPPGRQRFVASGERNP